MKILFLCAHPDDLEFSVPGMMISLGNKTQFLSSSKFSIKPIKKIQNGTDFFFKSLKVEHKELKIKIACMTRGEMSPLTDKTKSTLKAAKIRTIELNRSQKILTGGEPDYLGLLDGYVRVSEHAINILKNYLFKIRPDIIVAPEPIFAWYHHVDHKRTGKIAYFTLKRMLKEKIEEKRDIKVPRLVYFQSIWNDWYFPRYTEFQPIIEAALKCHKSQAALLSKARLPGYFEKLLHGLKVRNSIYGEALRFQYLARNYDNKVKKSKMKEFRNLPLLKRIVYYISYKLLNNANYDYSFRYRYFDGKMAPKKTEIWYGK